MKKLKQKILILLCAVTVLVGLTACNNDYRMDLSKEENIKYDIVQVMSYVRVADGFFATYGSIIPAVFVDDKWNLTYEKEVVDGTEMYVAIVSGEYYPDYADKESTKQGTIKFLMDLANEKKNLRAKAPWPYEDPDNIDDVIWRYVTHRDPSER